MHVCFSLEIIHSPESTVVFTDTVARFMCDAVNTSTIVWTFNGSLSYQLPTEINETEVFVLLDGVLQSNLTFQGRAEYNTTVVQCIAVRAHGGILRSANVTLQIQGMYICIILHSYCATFRLQERVIINFVLHCMRIHKIIM